MPMNNFIHEIKISLNLFHIWQTIQSSLNNLCLIWIMLFQLAFIHLFPKWVHSESMVSLIPNIIEWSRRRKGIGLKWIPMNNVIHELKYLWIHFIYDMKDTSNHNFKIYVWIFIIWSPSNINHSIDPQLLTFPLHPLILFQNFNFTQFNRLFNSQLNKMELKNEIMRWLLHSIL